MEKLKSLLKHGFRSTRYKDVFDFYFLITDKRLDKQRLKALVKEFIFDDAEMREKSYADIVWRVERTFKNPEYSRNIQNAKAAWLDVEPAGAMDGVLAYLRSL